MKSLFIMTLFLAISSLGIAQDYSGVYAVESRAFRGYYLRMDGGKNLVNMKNKMDSYEAFKFMKLADGTYSIESMKFKGKYLRMDGSAINKASKAPGGVVNIQSRVGSYEKFKITKLSDGSFSIESVAFPGRYLTMNPNPMPKNWNRGGGKVQVQNRAGSHERFNLVRIAGDYSGVYAIQSKAFRGYYLRMDANSNTVNIQNKANRYESFKLKQLADGTYSIESVAFPGQYLRMDGSAINKASKAPGGVVNIQSRVGSYEKFKITKLSDGSFSIESVAFPGRYLTMNPNPMPKNWSAGGGRVQVQNRAGAHERFNLVKK